MGASSNAAHNAMAVSEVLFMWTSSTVLRAGRHDFAAWQCQHPDKPGPGVISSTADLDGYFFAKCALEVRLGDIAGSEEIRRRPFDRPRLTLFRTAFDIHREVDVRISPIDLAECAVQRHAIVEVEERRHVVVRPRGRPGQEERYSHTDSN